IVFVVMGNIVLGIRRGPFGRLLGALRDSPAACTTLGLDLTRVKLGVFALSAAMAGIGGALWGGSKGAVTAQHLVYVYSLVMMLLVTIGGVNTITGAFFGGIFLAVSNIVPPHVPATYRQITF